mmetsp:Transcript_53762/g.128156  ORF Transcript_53762/g.128156 Transcript_53762/m.128156 type:complete len:282 (-) Transcript_53762:48-893(-)
MAAAFSALFERLLSAKHPFSCTSALDACAPIALSTAAMPPCAAMAAAFSAFLARLRTAPHPFSCTPAIDSCAPIAVSTASMPPFAATAILFGSFPSLSSVRPRSETHPFSCTPALGVCAPIRLMMRPMSLLPFTRSATNPLTDTSISNGTPPAWNSLMWCSSAFRCIPASIPASLRSASSTVARTAPLTGSARNPASYFPRPRLASTMHTSSTESEATLRVVGRGSAAAVSGARRRCGWGAPDAVAGSGVTDIEVPEIARISMARRCTPSSKGAPSLLRSM